MLTTAVTSRRRLANGSLLPNKAILLPQYNLGFMYYKGEGVPHDYEAAVKWYTLAAEQGNSNAQNNLGLMFANGQGLPEDFIYAHMWLAFLR